MSISFTYNLITKKGVPQILDLPDLKSDGLILRSFEIQSESKSFEIKIVGKDTILSYGEAVFYQSSKFNLFDKLTQIVDAETIKVHIKNLGTSKDSNNVALKIIFNYAKEGDGNIIFNNVYTNLNPEGLSSILKDISSSGKHVTKIIWTSPNKLPSLELNAQFETQPAWLANIKEVSNDRNQIIMDLTSDKYDADLIKQLCFYNLGIPENIEKICVIVYGYVH